MSTSAAATARAGKTRSPTATTTPRSATPASRAGPTTTSRGCASCCAPHTARRRLLRRHRLWCRHHAPRAPPARRGAPPRPRRSPLRQQPARQRVWPREPRAAVHAPPRVCRLALVWRGLRLQRGGRLLARRGVGAAVWADGRHDARGQHVARHALRHGRALPRRRPVAGVALVGPLRHRQLHHARLLGRRAARGAARAVRCGRQGDDLRAARRRRPHRRRRLEHLRAHVQPEDRLGGSWHRAGARDAARA
mmetsp:Transcript_52483/g.145172  ORF Transcript_52483/g.145172 Transcript_52483/m.145172 type:complete len:251 (+) Transcript_52483:952-1704(+)